MSISSLRTFSILHRIEPTVTGLGLDCRWSGDLAFSILHRIEPTVTTRSGAVGRIYLNFQYPP